MFFSQINFRKSPEQLEEKHHRNKVYCFRSEPWALQSEVELDDTTMNGKIPNISEIQNERKLQILDLQTQMTKKKRSLMQLSNAKSAL